MNLIQPIIQSLSGYTSAQWALYIVNGAVLPTLGLWWLRKFVQGYWYVDYDD